MSNGKKKEQKPANAPAAAARPKSFTADKAERNEQAGLARDLRSNDQSEEAAWGIKTDRAAFGLKRIKVPDRWY